MEGNSYSREKDSESDLNTVQQSVNDPEQEIKRLYEKADEECRQLRERLANLVSALGFQEEPSGIAMDEMVVRIKDLQSLEEQRSQWQTQGISDPECYFRFWKDFVKIFDPDLNPNAVQPELLWPNLKAVKQDAESLHRILDAFKKCGWNGGDEKLLTYLAELPVSILNSKSK